MTTEIEQVTKETSALLEMIHEIVALANELKLIVGFPVLVTLLIVWIMARYGVFSRVIAVIKGKKD